jgi:signal transduction histidine kinase
MHNETDITDWTIWLTRQRRIAINILLSVIVVFGAVGLVVSIIRSITGLGNPIYLGAYTLAYLVILFLFFYQGKSDKVRGAVFVTVMLLFSIFSLYQGWLAGSGRVFLITAIFIATILVSPRAGFITAGVTLVIYTVFTVLFSSGLLTLHPLPDPTTLAPIITEAIGFAMGVGIVIAGLWLFGEALQSASQANQNALVSRANFHSIVERSTDGILIASREGEVLFANDTAEIFFDRHGDELVGRQVPFAINTTERSEIKVFLPNHTKGTAELNVVETDWENKPAYLAILRDISDRKRIEQEVRELNADLERRVQDRTSQLEAANNELEAFSYSVSHDLRAPLRGVDGFSRILLNDFSSALPDEARRFLNIIRDSASQMNNLIDDLLRLSRINRLELNLGMVDISHISRDILNRLQSENPERKAEILIMDKLNASADDRFMQIVLENLLNNAWKFTGKNEVSIIEIGKISSSYGEKVFFIRDNGIGFDAAHANRLFGAFQRFHTNEEFSGTGIGLAIVQRIIHRHGGTIWAESKPGEGATFYFTL